jgi:hypothetical protein
MDEMANRVGQPTQKIGKFQKKPNENKWRTQDLNPGPSDFAVFHTLFESGVRKGTDFSS